MECLERHMGAVTASSTSLSLWTSSSRAETREAVSSGSGAFCAPGAACPGTARASAASTAAAPGAIPPTQAAPLEGGSAALSSEAIHLTMIFELVNRASEASSRQV